MSRLASAVSPLVESSVLVQSVSDEAVLETLGAVTKIIVEVDRVQTEERQRHCDTERGDVFPHTLDTTDFLRQRKGERERVAFIQKSITCHSTHSNCRFEVF